MKSFAVGFSFAFALLAGCATTEPYAGPHGPPTLEGREWLWPDINGHLRRETTVFVTNREDSPLDAVLDCNPHGSAHLSRNWMGSRLTLHVPPMTTQMVLLHPRDHVCNLLPVSDAE